MLVRSTFCTLYCGPCGAPLPSAAPPLPGSGFCAFCGTSRGGSLPFRRGFFAASSFAARRASRIFCACAMDGAARGMSSRPTRRPRCMRRASSSFTPEPPFCSREDSFSGGTAGASGSGPPRPSSSFAMRTRRSVLPSDLAT